MFKRISIKILLACICVIGAQSTIKTTEQQKIKAHYKTQLNAAEKKLKSIKTQLRSYGKTALEQTKNPKGEKLYEALMVVNRKINMIKEELYRINKGEVPELPLTIFDRTAFEQEYVI